MPYIIDLHNIEYKRDGINDLYYFKKTPNRYMLALYILFRETFKQQLYRTSEDLLKIINSFVNWECYCNECVLKHNNDKYLYSLYDPQYFKIIFDKHQNNSMRVSHFCGNSRCCKNYFADLCLQAFILIDHFKLFEKTKTYRFKTMCKIIDLLLTHVKPKYIKVYITQLLYQKMPIEYYVYFIHHPDVRMLISALTRFEILYKK